MIEVYKSQVGIYLKRGRKKDGLLVFAKGRNIFSDGFGRGNNAGGRDFRAAERFFLQGP